MKSILIVVAHPDDEVLGCGGTIAKLSDKGASIHVAFLADGVSSREDGIVAAKDLTSRRSAARKACDILGIQDIFFGDFPDNRMDTIALLDIVKIVESLIEKYKPDTILTHHAGDLNIDHRQVHNAVITSCRPQKGHSVKTLLFFEVPSSTEWQTPGSGIAFEPNWFENISTTLDRKLEALNLYEMEIREWPHSRSQEGVEYLAKWRGAIVGVEAAEAFILGRHIK
ncbi:MAG: PIG-L family deacetylase [Gammaproteobacteria bacterium]|nr:PIG-L family deacetylase [Gammaproteobacteria bacterium]